MHNGGRPNSVLSLLKTLVSQLGDIVVVEGHKLHHKTVRIDGDKSCLARTHGSSM